MLIGSTARRAARVVLVVLAVAVAACGKKTPPVARAVPPPTTGAGSSVPAPRPPAPPEPVPDPTVVPPEPVREDGIASASLDDLNRNSPIKPVFFEYDSSDITAEAKGILDANAGALKKYPTWTITIEGHSDERGTAEYNLALGERRAVAARAYLVSLGIPGDRLRTVSYGKEFPFDPGHDDTAWSKNRRAHFVITAK
jgi:peptidoglycan-associated lipoprotein